MTLRIRMLLHTHYYYTFTITARPLLLQMPHYYTFKVQSMVYQPITDYGYQRSLSDSYTATMTVLHIFSNNHTNKTYKNDNATYKNDNKTYENDNKTCKNDNQTYEIDNNKKGWPFSDPRY